MNTAVRIDEMPLEKLRLGYAVSGSYRGRCPRSSVDRLFGRIVRLLTAETTEYGRCRTASGIDGIAQFEDLLLQPNQDETLPQPDESHMYRNAFSEPSIYLVNNSERALKRIGSEKLEIAGLDFKSVQTAMQALYPTKSIQLTDTRGTRITSLTAFGVGIAGYPLTMRCIDSGDRWIDLRDVTIRADDESRPSRPSFVLDGLKLQKAGHA